MKQSFYAGKIVNGVLYYSDSLCNALCSIDLKTNKLKYVRAFPGEEALVSNQHIKCIEYDNKLFFIPNRGKYLHVLNERDGEIESFEINHCDDSLFVNSGAVVIYDDLWIFPGRVDRQIVKFNLKNYNYSFKKDLRSALGNIKSDGEQAIWKIACVNNKIIAAVVGTSIILEYYPQKDILRTIDSGIDKCESLFVYQDTIFLFTFDSRVYKWDPDTNQSVEAVIEGENDNSGAYMPITGLYGELYIAPSTGETFYKFNPISNCFEKLFDEMKNRNRLDGEVNYTDYDYWNKEVFVFPRNGNKIVIINNNCVKTLDELYLEDLDYEKKRWKAINKRLKSNKIVYENSLYDLEVFIRTLERS